MGLLYSHPFKRASFFTVQIKARFATVEHVLYELRVPLEKSRYSRLHAVFMSR